MNTTVIHYSDDYDYKYTTTFCGIILGICLLCIITYLCACAKVCYDSKYLRLKDQLLYTHSDSEPCEEGENS